MKAIIEAKKYRDTDSSYIVVEIRFLCVPMFYCKHPIKYPFSLLYFHCTFAFAILHELLTYFHYDTRTI